jgi:hypothetical protein
MKMTPYEEGNNMERESQEDYQRAADQYRAGKINNAQLLRKMREADENRRAANRLRGFTASDLR